MKILIFYYEILYITVASSILILKCENDLYSKEILLIHSIRLFVPSIRPLLQLYINKFIINGLNFLYDFKVAFIYLDIFLCVDSIILIKRLVSLFHINLIIL